METQPNATEILAAQFSKIDRTEIEIKGMEKLFCKPLNFEEKIKLAEIDKIKDPSRKALAMCKVIVLNVTNEAGDKVFRAWKDLPAEKALANFCDPDLVTEIFGKIVGVDLGDGEEAEAVAGKSEVPESD